MSEHMRSNLRKTQFNRNFALGTIGLSLFMLTASLILVLLHLDLFIAGFHEAGYGPTLVIFSIQGLITTALSLLILTRHPGHGVGRLFSGIGFLFSWFAISFTFTIFLGPDVNTFPAMIRLLLQIGSGVYLLPLILSMGMVPLYFPDGRLPSPRWRPALFALMIGTIGATLTQMLVDLQTQFPKIAQNLSIITQARQIASVILILGFMASLASLIVRYSQASGEERLRMKWLMYTAVVSIPLMLLMVLVLGEDSRILSGFSVLIPTYLTISIGIAILKHRLFDIDLIIRRTLQYVILTAILVVVFYGGVVVLQSLFDAWVGDHNTPIITVLSTLAIAAIFNPLRIRTQAFIDQRFYRAKYDAEKALADFSRTARDEVDLNTISNRLISVVAETVQPENITLLIQNSKTRR